MLSNATLVLVQEAVFEEIGEHVTPDAKIRSLVTDSLELASLIQTLEDVTGKNIPDEDLHGICTIQDVVNYVEAH